MTGYVVEREKLEHNIAAVRERAGDAAVYAAVKADGYGVGCLALARVCESCGIKRFAVTSGQEAAALTRGGVGYEEILMLTPTSDIREIEELSAMGVTFTAASVEDARALSKLWYTCGRKPRAHIKLDTGMGRRGFTAAQSGELAELYDRFSDIEFTGIYTHLCSGYDGRLAKRQYRTFKAVTDALTAQGISVGLRHIASSAALFYQPQMRMDAVRVGSALFGRMAGAERFGLLPTGRCFVEIESVRTLPKGSTVGYGACYKTRRPMQVATCPIGVHNGFGVERAAGEQRFGALIRELLRRVKRELSPESGLCAWVGGVRCPVLGTVGSEATVIDVSNARCVAGDTAVFDLNPMLLSHIQTQIM